jgi:hypothetical protein
MELTGKITAKIKAHTFDGVPEDTQVTIFIPGMQKPVKGYLSDIEIEGAAKQAATELTTVSAWSIFAEWNSSLEGQVGNSVAKPPEEVAGGAVLDSLKAAIPGLGDIFTTCPECGYTPPATVVNADGWVTKTLDVTAPRSLVEVIMHLNDYHRLSRSDIADWLEAQDWNLQFATTEENAT